MMTENAATPAAAPGRALPDTAIIRINGQREISVKPGGPLFGTLMEKKVFLPSACGGKGSCGLCRVKVISGAATRPLPRELNWLTPAQLEEGYRLACQLRVMNDLDLEFPEEFLDIREFRTKVSGIRDLTYDIKEITLKLIEPDEIKFRAGQFILFRIPPYELARVPLLRAYSISNPCHICDQVQLEIRKVPNGIGTTYIFNHLREGEEVAIIGPHGDMHLQDTERDIIFIAGGSGMAPIRAMLHDMRRKGINRKARYFFGARCKKDIFLTDEMEELQRDMPGFRFIPALSEPQPGEEWDGETGLITDVVARNVTSVENTEAYLCGSPGMIGACLKVLTGKGMPQDLIFYDKFA
jgi:Na+-transporting NADH:ubiquinone oxidoreductase subunit F